MTVDTRSWHDLDAECETIKIQRNELRAQRDRLKAVLEQLATRFKHGDAPENCHCTGCVIQVALKEVGE